MFAALQRVVVQKEVHQYQDLVFQHLNIGHQGFFQGTFLQLIQRLSEISFLVSVACLVVVHE